MKGASLRERVISSTGVFGALSQQFRFRAQLIRPKPKVVANVGKILDRLRLSAEFNQCFCTEEVQSFAVVVVSVVIAKGQAPAKILHCVFKTPYSRFVATAIEKRKRALIPIARVRSAIAGSKSSLQAWR
jgi:hypothetical protein